MYIMVSSFCQMACAHCLFSCSPKRGQHMAMDTFRQTVEAARKYDAMVMLGGGEPTLHPEFDAMLGLAVVVTGHPVMVITNGTCPEPLWNKMLDARIHGILDIGVSNDLWHDASLRKPWVDRDAEKLGLWWGDPASGHRALWKRGRAKRNWSKLMRDCEMRGIKVTVEDGCGSLRVTPDGRVWPDVPGVRRSTGTVDNEKAIMDSYDTIRKWEER